MSQGHIDGLGRDMGRYEGDPPASVGVANWLSLAAAPTFAIMALVTAAHGGGATGTHGSGPHEALPLSGMAMMYVLMSLFHAVPWLKWIAGRRSKAQSSLLRISRNWLFNANGSNLGG